MARRAKFKKGQLSDADIPTASFSDLAFLLIIFFILTTTLRKEIGFKSEFPSGEQSQTQQQEKVMNIALHDGELRLNDQPINLPTLKRRLKDAKFPEKKADEKVVVLTSTGKVRYQEYYEIMSLITAAGGVVAIERELTGKKGK